MNSNYEEDYDDIWDLEEAIEEFVKTYPSKLLHFYSRHDSTWDRDFDESLNDDMNLMPIGVTLLILYGTFILGKLHPIHSRAVLAVLGLGSVMIAYVEALGLSMYFGLNKAGSHAAIPFLLLGIGLDDMFVLVAALDPEI